MTCIWKGRENPRAIRGRHEDDCADDECKGCRPCPDPHCVVCGIEHVDQRTCPECVGASREDLFEIRKLWRDLPAQALHGGGDGKLEAGRDIPGGEATVLLGPGSDGRGARAARRRGDDATHMQDERDTEAIVPELCLVTWEDDWRNMLGSPTKDEASLDAAAEFLDEHLSWAAQHHDAFDAFASEIRRQRAHLEDVLHAGERDETGAPCLACSRPMVLVYGKTLDEDRWTCRCGRSLDRHEYAHTTAQESKPYAEWLPATDMSEVYDVPTGSLRGWASEGLVAKRRDVNLGRMVYSVADVKRRLEARRAVSDEGLGGERDVS